MIDVNDKNFKREVVESSKKGLPVIVVFYAAWCHASQRMLERVIPRFEEKYSDKIKFVKIPIEEQSGKVENPLTKAEYKIERFPSLIIFRKGQYSGLIVSEKDAVSQYMDVKELMDLALNHFLD